MSNCPGRPAAQLLLRAFLIVVTVVLITALAPPMPAGAQESTTSPFGAAAAAESPDNAAPGWFDRLMIEIRMRQRDLQRELADAVRATDDTGSPAALAALLGLCFLYGIFHAVGPGHGKAVITAYALTSERIMWRAIGIAFLAAFIQATTAVLLVYAVLLTLDGTTRLITRSVTVAEAASFLLIAAMGGYLLIGGLRRLSRTRPAAAAHRHDHSHDRHDHGDDHVHGHHDHAHMPDAETVGRVHGLRDAIALSIAVGIRPCTGAILVLVFAYGLGLHAAGIGSAYAMGAGTGIAVALLVAAASLLKLPQSRAAARGRHWALRADVLLRILGGLAIIAIGLLLFWAVVSAPAAPFAG
ncbi:MAG: high frequency lysogenization protein HflD [Dongiaceae bacterium]